ncbi:hypothetical protein DOTSEDRAFT_68868 [Dothistroma septosporum NZE10]|uniref:Uncharacterized protein n=1 Tax=Dothistroma septosporum (strain NZE10 / CBS 128990) TaxID=675120 RepID=N1Q390_DOTSN|nr:hypothetical protein DOTSEDRAFT_68868 [Dothistroma septosporum NZE10]
MEAAVRWSPQSTGDRGRFLLVDVNDGSLTLNEVHSRRRHAVQYASVARVTRLPNFSAFDWSKTDASIVALGLVSGSACLVKLREDGRSSDTVATFKLKQQRKCNSIALNRMNWLAVALDKTRSDNCLNIYDAAAAHSEPIRRLCPAEVVSSARFFPSQPEELVVAAQRSLIRLYDLRDGYFANTNNTQVSTRNVNNIAIDPLDENYFASAGSSDDPSVSVWDKRWINQTTVAGSNSGAVFDFRPAVDNSARTSVWSLRYSGQRRGRLAICSSRGELKIVDMVEGNDALLNNNDYLSQNTYGGLPWSCNRYVSHSREISKAVDVLEDNDRGDDRLIAFDWIVDHETLAEQHVLALRSSRRIDVIRVPSIVPAAALTARGDLALTFQDINIAEVTTRAKPAKRSGPYEHQRSAEDFGPHEYNGEAVDDEGDIPKIECVPGSSQLDTVLATSSIQRERCRRGYLFDCNKNIDIVSGNWQLERLWEIVGRFETQAADHGMTSGALDLSFVGVTGICTEKVGGLSRRTLSPAAANVEDAIYDLNGSRELPPFDGVRTNHAEHRQLALELCGWKFTTESLETECQELIDRGLYYQAIVQAVLHEYKHIALNLLRTLIRSKTVPNIGLGALLASNTINDEQREMCQWMAADTDDPALKALLTFLTTGNWRDVMKTNYLHLGYRVALGLKYLNDSEIHGFLQSETARAVKNGDLEGILLTGLGDQAMDLFQTYIAKTNDLQTAVLATGFTSPLYVADVRWEMWKDTYFMQMQSWRAFIERTRFVVQHTQMSRTRDGHSMLASPRAQVTLRCAHCQQPLASRNGSSTIGDSGQLVASSKDAVAPQVKAAASAGVSCSKCGSHMPRCGICKMWLGTPDPAYRGGAKELQSLSDVMAKFITFCVGCQHGFHAHHAHAWFEKHTTCPVPGCICRCTIK